MMTILTQEQKQLISDARKRRYQKNKEQEKLQSSERYYQNKQRALDLTWPTTVENGIESYILSMIKFYSKKHRLKCQQQLKKDFQELQQYLKVA